MKKSNTRLTGIALAGLLAVSTSSVSAADNGKYEPAPTGAIERIGAAAKGDEKKEEPTSTPPKVVGKGSGPEKRDFKIISESEARKQGTLGSSGSSSGNSSTGDSTGGAASGAGNSGN